MEPRRQYPDRDRLSVLSATILLAYALTPFVDITPREWSWSVAGILLNFSIQYQTLISVLVAALAAAGMNWLLSDHPALMDLGERERQLAILPHLLVPTLTAWVIGVPLANLPHGMEWWAVFAMGGTLLVLVIIAEYMVVDLSGVEDVPAAMGLTALSFALYLILAITLRAADVRLYLMLPALVPTAGLLSLRTIYLRLGERWAWPWAVGIALVVGQIATGLHYLPVSPVRFGLLLVAPLYALTSLAGAVAEGGALRKNLAEPLTMLVILGVLAVWMG